MTTTEFSFQHERGFRPLLLLFGVTPGRSSVVVDDARVRIRFGLWTLTTPRANVAEATVTGPYRWWKAIGLRTSLVDRGVTFGSTTHAGACLRLHEPVAVRLGRITFPIRHPGVTITVADPAGLADLLSGPAGSSDQRHR